MENKILQIPKSYLIDLLANIEEDKLKLMKFGSLENKENLDSLYGKLFRLEMGKSYLIKEILNEFDK